MHIRTSFTYAQKDILFCQRGGIEKQKFWGGGELALGKASWPSVQIERIERGVYKSPVTVEGKGLLAFSFGGIFLKFGGRKREQTVAFGLAERFEG